MGKIRVKTFGDEEQELKEKEKLEKRKEAKKAKESEVKKDVNTKTEEVKEEVVEEVKTQVHKKQVAKSEKQFHSNKYLNLANLVDKTKTYSLIDGLKLLETLQRKTTDETVELHINTPATGVSGNVTLPHGTGKKTKVVIANDALIAEIEKGKIDFDILLAEPQMMVKLAKVAKILGPRGLMPNPKNGTVTSNPEEVAKKYEGGQVNFKTEKAPILHLVVGKMSFGSEKLSQNIEALIAAIKKSNIVNVTLKSTMSPGIKIKV
jgi:large subunit ribosomal protein L1